MPTPLYLDRALSPMQIEDTTGEGERERIEEEGLEDRWRRRRRGWVGLRKMPVMPCLEASTRILEILILRSYHVSELIMPLLGK